MACSSDMPGDVSVRSDGFETALRETIAPWRLFVAEDVVRTLRAHFAEVLEVNQQFNLTRLTEPVEAAIKLYADSLSVVAWAEEAGTRVRTVLDAGTGAGIPAVPVAVVQPRWLVTAVDGTAKKAAFVRACAAKLGVANLAAYHGRVEQMRAPPAYDLILFKAVSRIAECLRWAQHLVATGGHVVLYKTRQVPVEEEESGRHAAARLAYREVDRFDYTLRCRDEMLERTLRVFRRG